MPGVKGRSGGHSRKTLREHELAALARVRAIKSSPRGTTHTDAELERRAKSVVANWRAAFHKHPEQARQAVQVLLDGRITLTRRREDEKEFYEFDGIGTLQAVLTGVLVPHNLASPSGSAPLPVVTGCVGMAA
jgi:hypothetical protein